MRLFLAPLLVVVLAACALGQDYILKNCVIDEGGNQVTSSGYTAKLSFGQPIASNTIASSGFHAILGFWHPGLVPGIQEPEVNTMTARPAFALGQNVPNPFRSRAVINYSLPAETEVDMKVFGQDGRVVTTLVSGRQKAGRYRVTWSLDSRTRAQLANGVYFYRLTAGDNTATRKMVRAE
jgi:hypothetical protein